MPKQKEHGKRELIDFSQFPSNYIIPSNVGEPPEEYSLSSEEDIIFIGKAEEPDKNHNPLKEEKPKLAKNSAFFHKNENIILLHDKKEQPGNINRFPYVRIFTPDKRKKSDEKSELLNEIKKQDFNRFRELYWKTLWKALWNFSSVPSPCSIMAWKLLFKLITTIDEVLLYCKGHPNSRSAQIIGQHGYKGRYNGS